MLVGRPLGALHREVLLRRGSTLCTIRFPARPACRWTNAAAAAWMCVLSALLGSPRRCPLRSLLSSLAWFPVLRLQVAEMVLMSAPSCVATGLAVLHSLSLLLAHAAPVVLAYEARS